MQKLRTISTQVVSLYEELDEVHNKLALSCDGCRLCCDTPAYNIEVSMMEFFPLAWYLLESGQFERWYEKSQRVTPQDRCLLLETNSAFKPEGGCSFHRYRPLICRLFSASFVVRKTPQILSCVFLKEKLQNNFHQLVNAQVYFDRLYNIDPGLAINRYDINTAFRKALEYVGLRLWFNNSSFPLAG
ncbi:YkgJ family cysteine cluster protein [Pseudothermotoga sp.]|uniref:YkgJ family cysteine cluster protein n=1 Tax=Pseudothermotoga sp. TaxID=2033661 RepID=UPI0031F6AED9